MGDFYTYVIDWVTRHFAAPENYQKKRRSDAKKAAAEQLAKASTEPNRTLTEEQIDELSKKEPSELTNQEIRDLLNQNHFGLLAEIRSAAFIEQVYPFDTGLAARWIFQRVLSLGWSVELFGDFDRR